MIEPIIAVAHYTPAVLAKAAWRHNVRRLKLLFFGSAAYFLLCLFSMGLGLVSEPLRSWVYNSMWVGVFLLVWTSIFLNPWGLRRALVKQISFPPNGRLSRWTIGEDKILISEEGVETTIEWSRYKEVYRTPEGFLLYYEKNLFHYLPSDAFATPDGRDAFAELAHRKVSGRS